MYLKCNEYLFAVVVIVTDFRITFDENLHDLLFNH